MLRAIVSPGWQPILPILERPAAPLPSKQQYRNSLSSSRSIHPLTLRHLHLGRVDVLAQVFTTLKLPLVAVQQEMCNVVAHSEPQN